VTDIATFDYGKLQFYEIKCRDGIEEITQVLQQNPQVNSVYIVAQGSPGSWYLGNTHLSLDNLDKLQDYQSLITTEKIKQILLDNNNGGFESIFDRGNGIAFADLQGAQSNNYQGSSFPIPQEATSVASADYRINSLLTGYKWGVTSINFSFYSGGSYYGSETDLDIVSDGIKANVRNILNNVIAPLINVNFVEVADSASSYGQIRYLLSTSPGYAYAYSPFSTDTNQGNDNDLAGDVFLNPTNDNSSSFGGFQGGPGTHGYQTIIHETLHALGLKHPGNYNGSDVGNPPYLPYGEENWDNTLMTYNFNSGAEPSTPMPYDVLALQYLYGAKSYNSSSTTYNFTRPDLYSDGSLTVGSALYYNKITIWDSGGIDTLNFSSLGANAYGYRFDLNAGGWLSRLTEFNAIGYNVNAGPPVSFTSGTSYYANFSGTRLAYGVTIENLINSSSNDYIIANSTANVFSGYGLSNTTGADIIEGANNLDFLDLSAFTVANVTQTQSGNNLVLGLGLGRSVTVKDYYAVSAASRIQIGFSNATPTNLTLSNNTIAENQAIGTGIGTFTSTDPDTGNTFTYSLVTGTGSTDNALFAITGNQLQSNGIFDFETKNSYSIRVRTTDQGGLSYEKQLTIGVSNVNETPTNLTLSNSTVSENQILGTVIGNFTTTDPDTGNTFTYSLVTGTGATDNSLFAITNNQLKTNSVFDYETKNSYSVRVKTTDQGGLSYEKQLTIGVNDLDEITGNPLINNGRTPIVGTAGSDYIIGGPGAKTITGGAGNDFFVFTDLRDVGQRITDFTVGTDKIVLTQLMGSINYIGIDPIADQYMRFVAGTGSNTGSTFLQIDRDGISGSATFKNFLQVDNITTTQLNNVNNFVF